MINDDQFYKDVLGWLIELGKKELPSDIKAVYIGLFESPDGYYIYLTGYKSYDVPDWPANKPDFEPKNKYLLFNEKEVASLKWQEFLSLIGQTLLRIKNSEHFSSTIISKPERVSYGFDDGDLYTLV